MSNRASFLKVSKEYRELAHPGALGRVFSGFANKLYARKKLAPINYKLSIAWKQHVMNLMKKQQTAQQKVNNLEKRWKKGMNPANFKSQLNAAKRALEQAKRNTEQARKQKILTVGNVSTPYTKQGQVPRALPPSPTPVSFGPFLNRLVYIVNSKVPNVAGVLDDEFGKEYKFNSNRRVNLRTRLGTIEGNKRLPWSIRMAARRRAIKLGRESTSYNQEKARRNNENRQRRAAAALVKRNANRAAMQAELLKKERNEKKRSVMAKVKASTLLAPKTRLNTITENNNGLSSHPLANNNNFQNALESLSNNNNSPSKRANAKEEAAKTKLIQNAGLAAAKATAIARLKGPAPKGILKPPRAYPRANNNNFQNALESLSNNNNGNAHPLPLITTAANVANNAAQAAENITRANNAAQAVATVAGPEPSRRLGIAKALEENTGSRITRLMHESVKPPSPPKPRRSLRNRARELRERLTGGNWARKLRESERAAAEIEQRRRAAISRSPAVKLTWR